MISFVNAFSNPHAGARTTINGKIKVRIKRLSYQTKIKKFHPFQVGLIYRIIKSNYYVAHKDGTIILSANIDEENYCSSVKIRLGDRFYLHQDIWKKLCFQESNIHLTVPYYTINNVINSLRVLGLILARAGSKGLPGKNTKILHGKPLLAWSVDDGRNSFYIDDLVVSTDCNEIASQAKKYGAEAPF